VQVTSSVRTLTPQPVETVVQPVRARSAVVRPVPVTPNAKPHVVAPTSFNEAQEVADTYKANTPVIVNLQDADRELSRRLIDFASGLCYGLGGTMERVANSVYLLTPSNVELSAEERRRLHERGLYD
jgi:cell division inhibitor SepF